jgi:hypothetical protein
MPAPMVAKVIFSFAPKWACIACNSIAVGATNNIEGGFMCISFLFTSINSIIFAAPKIKNILDN